MPKMLCIECRDLYLDTKIKSIVNKKSDVHTENNNGNSILIEELYKRSLLIKNNFFDLYVNIINAYYTDCVKSYKNTNLIDVKIEIFIENLLDDVLNDDEFLIFKRKVILKEINI